MTLKKHVRKFKLSGVITSDPFAILHQDAEFHKGLYKSYHSRVQQVAASFNYEDLTMPKLSQECKRLGEGVLTLEECSNVLNSFALNKVPGNGWLPEEC